MKPLPKDSNDDAHVDTLNVDRAQSLIMMGEVSSGRHALEGAPLALGTQRTLEQLRDRAASDNAICSIAGGTSEPPARVGI